MKILGRCQASSPDVAHNGASREIGAVYMIAPSMTPEERDRMNRICVRIQEERDPEVFDRLVDQLEELLEAKQERIRAVNPTSKGNAPVSGGNGRRE